MWPPPHTYGSRAISLPALITAWTAAGALTGGIARPPGVSVAWFGLAEMPLAARAARTWASEIGWGRAPPAAGPTLTSPAPAPLAPAPALPALAPAPGPSGEAWPATGVTA